MNMPMWPVGGNANLHNHPIPPGSEEFVIAVMILALVLIAFCIVEASK